MTGRLVMYPEKPKKKNSPRRLRFAFVTIVLMVLLAGAILLSPHAEQALNGWLNDDPFTPICHVPELEVAYMRGDLGEVQLYRARLNGDNPTRVSDLYDPHATQFRWTPDGRYLTYHMSQSDSSRLHLLDTDDNTTTAIDVPEYPFRWQIMPDSSAIIIDMWSASDNVYRIDLPLVDPVAVQEIDAVPHILQNPPHPHSSPFSNYHPQGLVSDDNRYVVSTQKTEQRDGVNKGQHIVVREADSDALIWDIGKPEHGYDIEYVILDLSPANDLLYFRRYYPVGENVVAPDMPYEAFIADIEGQDITPILAGLPPHPILALRWIPDHDVMFIQLNNIEADSIDIYLADADGSNPSHLTSIPSLSYSTVSFQVTPDGHYLAYVEQDNQWLYLLDLDTRDKCRVVKGRTDNWTTYHDWRLIDN